MLTPRGSRLGHNALCRELISFQGILLVLTEFICFAQEKELYFSQPCILNSIFSASSNRKKSRQAIGQLGQYHSGSTLENGIIELEKEGRRRDSTDGRTTYIHLSPYAPLHSTPLTTAKGFGIALWGSHSPSTVWIARPPSIPIVSKIPDPFGVSLD